MLSFVGIRELSNNTKGVMANLVKGKSIVVTDHGKPKAMLIGISDENSFEEVYKLVKQYEIEMQLKSIRKKALQSFPDGLSDAEINKIINMVRNEKSKK